MREVVLYLCAAAVIFAGTQLLVELAGVTGGFVPLELAKRVWVPVPPVAAALVGLFVTLGVAQIVYPAMIDVLQRGPDRPWWQVLTALLAQSDGWTQLIFNLAALAAIAPVAERVLGPWTTLLVFAVAGVASQTVSALGWSRYGGGDSVAICGLLGALTVLYMTRGPRPALRRLLWLIPATTVVLCVLTNNHGVGLAVGCMFGSFCPAPGLPPIRGSALTPS
jgi:rhomboid protease GluP